MNAMSATTQILTADELLAMPDDGHRYELVNGELRVMAPAGGRHGSVAAELIWRLAQHVQANGLGKVFAAETGFKIRANPDTVRAPDVAFVSGDRIAHTGIPEGFWPGAPDLAVEVVSPSDVFTDVDEKVADWLAAGTRMVIVLNPRVRSATVYHGQAVTRLGEGDAISGADVVPGWSVPVRDLFR